jgi:hypothetical protein
MDADLKIRERSLVKRAHYSQQPFATEDTEFTEKGHYTWYFGFLRVLGVLCGAKNFYSC